MTFEEEFPSLTGYDIPVVPVFTDEKRVCNVSHIRKYTRDVAKIKEAIKKGYKCPHCKAEDKPKCIEVLPLLKELGLEDEELEQGDLE